ncbi:MAG: WecB/TagA/CpsF family glycosyltransferase [Oscillospiraceae bacterium]|jgi:glycosyltransferase, WecB/TagA/CpsF family|nr:WecB/TagA/CpsF family glycosyltransferase [Oscillospiraceae bacterium]
MSRTDVLGVGFDNVTKAEAVERALELIDAREGRYVVTPNPEIVMLAKENPALKEALAGADIVLPDGAGIVKGAAILGRPMKEKVPGIDFACGVMARLAERGGSVYLFGAKPGVAEAAAETLRTKFPGLVISGTSDGYFSDDGPIIEKIKDAAPDFLLVCLGAPKQELWMAKMSGKLLVGLMVGLGGSLDVFAGTVKRAPEAWQKLDLEWLYRLLKEPRRIGRMMKLPLFVIEAAGERLRGK